MKLRNRRKKSQVGKTLSFLFLAIIFICSTVFLAHQTIIKVDELEQTKSELSTLETAQTDLEKDVEEIVAKEDELKSQVITLEEKLSEIKKNNPNENINLEDTSKKYAYLTFDDGPSKNTVKILDFLKANGVKATFFVVGDYNQEAIYKRIVEEGHTLAVHSNTHKYNEIYKNVDSFMKDIHDLRDMLQRMTGVRPSVLRFPGGSNNNISKKHSGFDIMEQIIPKIQKDGFAYFDWNVDSGDANKANEDKQIIVDTVLSQSKDKVHAIILMHDAAVKTSTVEALPQIVQELRKQGFIFKELTSESPAVHFR
ncbi:MAG: polysaccharide deacetylase [Clostridia bacterium]|jgi:peptidoglycan/xylan/chitin deacetylase (PgdA/CDA1 family)|nr:polysaccharide deacetylase [Clostridia bacterium]